MTHRPRRRRPGRGFLAVLAVTVASGVSGCSAGGTTVAAVGSTEAGTTAAASPKHGRDPMRSPSPRSRSGAGTSSYAVPAPGPLTRPLLSADLLVTGADTLPERMVERFRSVPGVAAVLPISLASASVEGRTITVAAADPARFRRFTPYGTAYADAVWDRVAGGEVSVDTGVSRRLFSRGAVLRLGGGSEAGAVHVGAYVPLVTRIQAVVNAKRGRALGIPRDNALLVSTGSLTPSALAGQFRRIVGDRATLHTLAIEFDLHARQTAVLTGGSVSEAVGHFSYTNLANGEIRPDPAWVHEYIRTEQVPILGKVTCNKAMLPQLRAALAEVVRSGLASAIHPDEYAGCYYPRYINRNPADGLSLHSWGIAVDLNVPGNLRGTAGEIDRRVVAIFKRWGFAWGGDWHYTDPMHFEMNAVVRPG